MPYHSAAHWISYYTNEAINAASRDIQYVRYIFKLENTNVKTEYVFPFMAKKFRVVLKVCVKVAPCRTW